MSNYIVIVKRYDQPERYGIHTDLPNDSLRKGVFWAIGLFSKNQAATKLSEPQFDSFNTEIDPENFDLEKLINCAPIEWHSAMRQGDMLDRFEILSTQE